MRKLGKNNIWRERTLLAQRTEDKLLEKTSWYKGNLKRKLENQESKYKYNPPAKRRRKGHNIKTKKAN